jgi:hypothetical protein
MSFSRKVGVSHTTLKEVAGSFEVSVKALKARLGSKVSVSDSVADAILDSSARGEVVLDALAFHFRML